jgi:hypothetical protein
MQSGATRLLRCALVLLALFHVAHGRGQSMTFTRNGVWGQSVTFTRSGVCTIYSPDRGIRLMLEKIADGANGGSVDGALQATMVSWVDEKETTLWTRRIQGDIYDFLRADSVVLAEKGDWFLVTPGLNDELGFCIYSAAGLKVLDVPVRHSWVNGWITGARFCEFGSRFEMSGWRSRCQREIKWR